MVPWGVVLCSSNTSSLLFLIEFLFLNSFLFLVVRHLLLVAMHWGIGRESTCGRDAEGKARCSQVHEAGQSGEL